MSQQVRLGRVRAFARIPLALCVLLAMNSQPAQADDEKGWTGWASAQPEAPVSLRTRTKPNSLSKSGAITEVEIRGDSQETVFFDVELELPDGKKSRWTHESLVYGQALHLFAEVPVVHRVTFTKVMTESARRRSLEERMPLWKTADIIFPKGTRTVKFHLEDPYTYSSDRKVEVAMFVLQHAVQVYPVGLTANFGWGARVYPRAAEKEGKVNARFYFGKAPINAVPPELFAEVVATEDGQVWDLEIRCTRAEKPNEFGLKGLDGQFIIDSPLWGGSRHYENFKVGLGGRTTLRFAVSTEE